MRESEAIRVVVRPATREDIETVESYRVVLLEAVRGSTDDSASPPEEDTCEPVGDHGVVYNHAPLGYRCPFCRNLATGEADLPLQILHRDDSVFVKMNPKWAPRNPGAALVIPNRHYENVYDLPAELGSPIQRAIRSTALAMKDAFGCDGVSTRQHNEPDGNQDVWHYHVHVVPRWNGDDLYAARSTLADPNDLRLKAALLRAAWPSR